MRVYGALMWSLGKVIKTPEGFFQSFCFFFVRVDGFQYCVSIWVHSGITSIWTRKTRHFLKLSRMTFSLIWGIYVWECDRSAFSRLGRSLPRNSAVRKVNELVKRGRCAKVSLSFIFLFTLLLIDAHRCTRWLSTTCVHSLAGLAKKQIKNACLRRFQKSLKLFNKLIVRFHLGFQLVLNFSVDLPVGDFPSPARFKELISKFKIWEFPEIKPKWTKSLDDVLTSGSFALKFPYQFQFRLYTCRYSPLTAIGSWLWFCWRFAGIGMFCSNEMEF